MLYTLTDGRSFLILFFLQHAAAARYILALRLCISPLCFKEGFLLIFSYIAKLYNVLLLHMEKCYTCQVLLLLGKHFMALLLKVGLLAEAAVDSLSLSLLVNVYILMGKVVLRNYSYSLDSPLMAEISIIVWQ